MLKMKSCSPPCGNSCTDYFPHISNQRDTTGRLSACNHNYNPQRSCLSCAIVFLCRMRDIFPEPLAYT